MKYSKALFPTEGKLWLRVLTKIAVTSLQNSVISNSYVMLWAYFSSILFQVTSLKIFGFSSNFTENSSVDSDQVIWMATEYHWINWRYFYRRCLLLSFLKICTGRRITCQLVPFAFHTAVRISFGFVITWTYM